LHKLLYLIDESARGFDTAIGKPMISFMPEAFIDNITPSMRGCFQ
jgi:hypothetical protein